MNNVYAVHGGVSKQLVGGSTTPATPKWEDYWDASWLPMPTITESAINGKANVIAMLIDVYDVAANYIAYNLGAASHNCNVYTSVGGTLLASNYKVGDGSLTRFTLPSYASATHQVDTNTRQFYVELVPTGNLTSVAMTSALLATGNSNAKTNICALMARLPQATTVAGMLTGHQFVKMVYVHAPIATSISSLIENTRSVRAVKIIADSATSATSTCFNSYSLLFADIHAQSATAFSSTFYNDKTLKYAKLYSAAAVDMNSICYSCQNLTGFDFIVPNATGWISSFSGCSMLPEINLVLNSATTIAGICSNCGGLVKASIVAPLAANANNVLSACVNLEEATLSIPSATVGDSLLNSCQKLRKLTLNAPALITSGTTLAYCYAITEVNLTLPNITFLNQTLHNCISLRQASITVGTACYLTSNIIGATTSSIPSNLVKLTLAGLTAGISINYTSMDATALNNLMYSLGTANGTQTLNITNNYGSAGCDPTIATAKGWTVTR